MWADVQRDARPVVPSVQCGKVWLTPTTRVPCSNAANTRNPLKLPGVPQTGIGLNRSQPLVGRSSPYSDYMWRRYCCLTIPIVDKYVSCEDIARQSCTIVARWRFFGDFLRPVFSPSRVQQDSDLHFKFALRPLHVLKYGRHQIYDD